MNAKKPFLMPELMYIVYVPDSILCVGLLCAGGVFFGGRAFDKPTCFADCCGSLILSIKSEGEQEERGSCNSAYSFNFQHL